MKKILLACLVVCLLCGCSDRSKTYQFPNRNEPIESVELLYYPWFVDSSEDFMSFRTIRLLDTGEIESFMNALYELPTKEAGFTPPSNYGLYIARVKYDNGDEEYFGSQHIELVEKGTKAYAVGDYYFPGDVFDKLFLEYAGDINFLESD